MPDKPPPKPWREQTPLEKITHICKYRKMYASDGSLSSIGIFLHAYDLGLSDGGAAPDQRLNLGAFQQWLWPKLYASHKSPRNIGWEHTLDQIYGSDEEAFRQLPILYEEFLNAQPPEPTL